MSTKMQKNKEWQSSEDNALWRIYMNWYLENEKRLERDDKFDQRQPSKLSKLADLLSGYGNNNMVKGSSSSSYVQDERCCFPLDIGNQNEDSRLPDRLNPLEKIRIWRNIKAFQQEYNRSALSTNSRTYLSPCPSKFRDLYQEQRHLEMKNKRKLMKLLGCQEEGGYLLEDDNLMIEHKELGHARIPGLCLSEEKLLLVDRASGERPGLVDGDYIVTELLANDEEDGEQNGVYSGVCLRAINKGMHLIELSQGRVRHNSFKFCFYQALVGLLAKTQLRYKYATSANIDYIYNQAWMLFIHIGSMNLKRKLQLDDVVIYNYKYCVEIELVSEFEWAVEVSESVKKIKQAKRSELMKVNEQLGWEKMSSGLDPIKNLLHNLPNNSKNFILRCCRFSLGFWKDANFWYLYNPYRCDSFGFWDDRGNACIMKFASRSTLNRHIVILLLTARAYQASAPEKEDTTFPIKFFKITYNCVKIHNLQGKYGRDHYIRVLKEQADTSDEMLPSLSQLVEKKIWLDKFDMNWQKSKIDGNSKKVKWHEYYVVEEEGEGRLFCLWGEIHPTEKLFSFENRGNQVYACYVVAAGMIRIMAPEYWTPKTLDTIVMCGDRYYTLSRLQSEVTMSKSRLSPAHLLRYFKIGGIFFEKDVMKPLAGRLYSTTQHHHHSPSLWKMLHVLFSKYSFAILSCDNCCLGLFKLSGAYFMLDVNSVGPPVFNLGDGAGYLIRLTSFKKFLITLLLTIGSRESSQFYLYPVEILKIIEVHP